MQISLWTTSFPRAAVFVDLKGKTRVAEARSRAHRLLILAADHWALEPFPTRWPRVSTSSLASTGQSRAGLSDPGLPPRQAARDRGARALSRLLLSLSFHSPDGKPSGVSETAPRRPAGFPNKESGAPRRCVAAPRRLPSAPPPRSPARSRPHPPSSATESREPGRVRREGGAARRFRGALPQAGRGRGCRRRSRPP
jgi:hypothetical protein